MNRRSLCPLFISFVINCSIGSPQIAGGQSPSLQLLPRQQEIELATSAAPEHLRKEATVYVFGKGGYEKARSGTNGFTCLVNRDGAQSGDQTLRPTCWDLEGSNTIVPVMLRVGELLAQGKTAVEIKRDIDSGFSDGRFHEPRKTGIAYMLAGDVKQFDTKGGKVVSLDYPPHYMIYAPGVTNADIGMTKEGYQINPSLPGVYAGYSGGSHTAYIIVLATEHKGQMSH
ncbi:MAG TPA: hypothetical protein VN920_05260 [Pyrinomonadaceae bacterium]|nr:hypothetical protein [Pyrinomonadaceae bacterium]